MAFDIYCAAYPRGNEDDRTPEQVAGDFGIPVEAVYEAIRYVNPNRSRWTTMTNGVQDLFFEAIGAYHPEYKFRPRELYRPMTAETRARIKSATQKRSLASCESVHRR